MVRRVRSSPYGSIRSLIAGCSARAPLLLSVIASTIAIACRTPPPGLWVGGDVHLGERGVEAFAPLLPITEGRQGIINLEGPIHDSAVPPADDGIRLIHPSAAANVLAQAGVVAAGVVNNHAGDAGAAGVTTTLPLPLAPSI